MINEKKRKIREEEDFIDCPKFKNSINKLIEKHPNGIENDTIAKVLNITEKEAEELYNSAIKKIKTQLGI